MSRHNEIGAIGELLALEYLQSKNYEILVTNWRFGRAEIDIIAMFKDTLIFAEVKTRSYDYFGKPEEFVTSRKEMLIAHAANEYMKKIKYEWAIRFDIISIIYRSNSDFQLEHFEDAWW
ncbi:MAG: endonuclease [Saprospiraceae bacterium]|nr:endonuclease [Saprospiraceae bacterium]